MMTASFSDEMKKIAGHFAPRMRREGFRKRGNAFNRTTPGGLTHQARFFQIGAYSAGHGGFHLHFGVYCPDIRLYTGNPEPGAWVNDYDCCVRASIGPDRVYRAHHAWPVSFEEWVLSEVGAAFDKDLELLSRFQSSDDILNHEEEDLEGDQSDGASVMFETPLPIQKACILLNRGRTKDASTVLGAYLTHADQRMPAHADHLRSWAAKHGLL